MIIDDVMARHEYCKESRCTTCYNDAMKLQKFLEQELDCKTVDFLADYHKWLSNNGINPETEYGWFTPEVFKHKNILKYIKEWKEE